MEFYNSLSQRAQDLVQAGVIEVTVTLTRTGACIYARVTQPHAKLGVLPNKIYDLEEILGLLTKVKTPRTTDTIVPVGELSIAKLTEMGKAIKETERNGLRNNLPDNSLTYEDLVTPKKVDFMARACYVASRLGTPKIVSRIATDRENLTVNGASDLAQWWEKATPLMKWTVLSTRKQSGKFPKGFSYENLPETCKLRLNGCRCPFRDTGAKMAEVKEETLEEFQELEISDDSGNEDFGGIEV